MVTRKKFIQQALTLTAGVSLLGLNTANPQQKPIASKLDFPAFDLHAHPGRFYRRGISDYTGDERVSKTVEEMNEGGLSGAFFSTVVDTLVTRRTDTGIVPARGFSQGEAWIEYKRQIAVLNDLCLALPMRKATHLKDLLDRTSNQVAAFFACEGGDFLESASQLDELYADGVRSVQLVHYAPNPLGDLQTYASQHDGLSLLGKEVVRKMNTLGMVVDVAHASFKTVSDVVDISDKPIMLSHSILKLNEERPLAVRALTVEHAKMVASTGGVIGAWPSGFNTSFDDYIDNILRLIDVAGINHVGLGTDMDSNYKPVLDSYLQLTSWTDALTARGLTDEEVQKVAGANVARMLKAVGFDGE